MTVFLRVIESTVAEKPEALLRAVVAFRSPIDPDDPLRGKVFEVAPDAFLPVPGSPFSYWVSTSIRTVFKKFQRFESEGRTVKQGLATADDFRFVRTTWELPPVRDEERWFGFAKGGARSRFYSDIYLATNWAQDGREMKAWTVVTYGGGHWSRNLRNPDYYFRPGLTWPLRTQSGFGIRSMPAGCVFGHKGPAAFVEGDSPEHLLALLGVMSSAAFCYLVELQMAFGSYEVGVVQRSPVPDLADDDTAALAHLARRAWSLKRSLDTTNEMSRAFLLPPGLNEKVTGLRGEAIEQELESFQTKIDADVLRLYGFGSDDRAAIEAASNLASRRNDAVGDDEEGGDASEDESAVGARADALNSWLVGVVFNRFDPRLATGARPLPPEPEPFDALPWRSPGMWPEGEEPATRVDILVDDEGHADDIVARVRAVAECVRSDVPEKLRAWLRTEFFPLHIKMYSKSRRKAPIYWQLATPSAGYSVWLYLHAFSKDTFFRVQNDYVAPKVAHEERRLESLTSDLRDGATAAQRRVLAAQESLVDELRAFLEEVRRVASLWKPNLDDGVVINFAPLWRLVPQNKSWQKELKSTWDALCEGKYDWSHQAMHLWPDRVVPKCAKDRSLAIAHGLENVFWVEGADGKWAACKTPPKTVDELVREYTSPAVKSALKSLVEAPVASGKAAVRKTGGRREDAAASVPQDFAAAAAGAWARPHTMERGEIQAAILAVLKVNGAPMERRQARLAALLCLEPHLLAPQLDAAERKVWLRVVGGDAAKASTATIDSTTQEWGQALSGLRGRGRLDENIQQNTWALGTGIDAIDTSGWPEGRAGFVVNFLRSLQASAPADAIIFKLPTPVQQWFANAA